MLPKNFPYRKELKRKAGEDRQKEFDKLTPQEVLAQLDRSFGPGQGATKQRARLARKMATPVAQPEPVKPAEQDEKPTKKPAKKREGKRQKNSDS